RHGTRRRCRQGAADGPAGLDDGERKSRRCGEYGETVVEQELMLRKARRHDGTEAQSGERATEAASEFTQCLTPSPHFVPSCLRASLPDLKCPSFPALKNPRFSC